MSSTGQAIGMVVGAVVGFFVPVIGVALGASIGGMIGSAIDPPKGPDITGPRLNDLSLQTSTYGASLARAYGTVAVLGNLFWLEGDKLKETSKTEEVGGKGGGGQESTTYQYSATFAVGLLHIPNGETASLRRLWIDTDLVYEAASEDIGSIIGSANAIASGAGAGFSFYSGSDDQLPNPRMQADKGAANVSAYPGLCYIVMNDLALEKYSNTLLRAQIKAELAIGPAVITCTLDTTPDGASSPVEYAAQGPDWYRYLSTVLISPTVVESAMVKMYDYHQVTYQAIGMEKYRNELGVSNDYVGVTEGNISGEDSAYLKLHQSDRKAVYALKNTHPTAIKCRVDIYDEGMFRPGDLWHDIYQKLGSVNLLEGNFLYSFKKQTYGTMVVLLGNDFYAESTEGFDVLTAGYSETYIFVVDDYYSSMTTCFLRKVSKQTLSTIAAFSFTAEEGNSAVLHVVSDTLLYVASGEHVYRVDNFAAATDLGVWFSGVPFAGIYNTTWFRVFSENPPYAVLVREIDGPPEMHDMQEVYVTHEVVPHTAALLSDIVTSECGLAGLGSGDINVSLLGSLGVQGFHLSGPMTPRAALEPLQAACRFDVAQSGYQLKFVPRGMSSVAAIPEIDLGATSGDDVKLLPISREMESQLPRQVSVKFIDYMREYDIGQQSSERPTRSKHERMMELPICMTETEAAGVADVMLEKDWVERTEFGPFALPPTWGHLEATDVITVSHRGRDYELRLTRVEYLPDGSMVCAGRMTSAASYVSTALAAPALVPGQSLVLLSGSTSGMLLDIPTILDSQNTTGLVFGLYGKSAGWPGGVLMRSDDLGNTYSNAGAMNSAVHLFTAEGSLAAGHRYTVENGPGLKVRPVLAADTSLSSASDAQFFAGYNVAAYGAHGRWEIINFRTAVDNGDGSYYLRDFARGLFGTERFGGTHVAGDAVILLRSAVGFSALPIAAIGTQRLFRYVTQGGLLDSASDVPLTYSAMNLTPLSGVKINGNRHWETFDWTVTWSPRSRTPVALFSGFATPDGESSALYEAEVWTSGFAALKRTLTGLASPTFTYTSAQQITDFASNQGVLNLRIYKISANVGRGAVFETIIDRYAYPDPYRLFVTGLFHMETTGLTDQMGNTVTLVGNTVRSSARFKYGAYSALFDGTGDYMQMAASSKYDFGTGDFTVEAFVYIAANSAQDAWPERTAMIFSVGTSGGTYQFTFGIQGSSTTTGTGLNVSAGAGVYPFLATISQLAWHHVAVCRYSGTTYVLLDGARIGTNSAFNGVAMGSSVNPAYAGGRPYSLNYNQYLNGNIDELRITKAARYKDATYTIPTEAFPNP